MSTRRADSGKKAVSNSLNRQIGLYSLAAAAAGVSLLATAQPAAAEVVVTQKTISIPMSKSGGLPQPIMLSLTNNAVPDIVLSLSSFVGYGRSSRFLGAAPPGSHDGVRGWSNFIPFVSALPRGAKIGSNLTYPARFLLGGVVEESFSTSRGRSFQGEWIGNPKDRYLGVRFEIDGQLHYGWVRLTVTTHRSAHAPFLSAKVTAYAYETEPNTPIYAGLTEEPTAELQPPAGVQGERGPSLGMLALGAEGAVLWRREKSGQENISNL